MIFSDESQRMMSFFHNIFGKNLLDILDLLDLLYLQLYSVSLFQLIIYLYLFFLFFFVFFFCFFVINTTYDIKNVKSVIYGGDDLNKYMRQIVSTNIYIIYK